MQFVDEINQENREFHIPMSIDVVDRVFNVITSTNKYNLAPMDEMSPWRVLSLPTDPSPVVPCWYRHFHVGSRSFYQEPVVPRTFLRYWPILETHPYRGQRIVFAVLQE